VLQDAYIPNPAMTTPLALGMFEFLGKLMGMSIRNRMNLPFRFPSCCLLNVRLMFAD
jgi:hypothetical protein